jgi:hypothetical protein
MSSRRRLSSHRRATSTRRQRDGHRDVVVDRHHACIVTAIKTLPMLLPLESEVRPARHATGLHVSLARARGEVEAA